MNVKLTTDLKILCASIVALVGSLGWYWAAAAGDVQFYASVGAPALSKSNLSDSGGTLFEVRFDVNEYSGDLIARTLSNDGSFTQDVFDDDGNLTTDGALWRAKTTVDAQSKRGTVTTDARKIFTSGDDGSGTIEGRRFSWDNSADTGLTATLKALVDPGAESANNDPDKSKVLTWNRGWDVNEGTGATDLRARNHALHNIVHPTPKYVGPPFRAHTFGDYATFRSGLKSRVPMVYVGSSMLHGFKASDGTEVFAYIPQAMLNKLEGLTSQSYAESFLVDGSPTVEDAYGDFGTLACSPQTSPCWQSVLAAGLNGGGSAIYALNVTDPATDADTEANAAARLFLWEFTHADLGETYAQPIIARLSNSGASVAIFSNGRGAGKAALFVVNIATGALIQKIDVPSTGSDNGLSSPAGWDSDFDGDIDVVYAGDLEGNLWRFEYDENTGSWAASFKDQSDDPLPLLTVSDPITGSTLPITARPVISINPEGGVFVYFGTGMNGQDVADTNAMFGIKDTGSSSPLGASLSLDVHSITPILYEDPDDPEAPTDKYRVITGTTAGTNAVGWKLQLPTGERIITNPILNNERVSFTSSDPSADDFNQNWFTGVDYATGGTPAVPFLDLNGDSVFNDSDKFDDIDDDNLPDTDAEGNPQFTAPISSFLDTGVVSAPTPANLANAKDTVYVTHGLESLGFSNPFGDPGLPGGHFDEDNFDWSPPLVANGAEATGISAASCWDADSCHTHEYDDVWDINGVNFLDTGGQQDCHPDVECATGILSNKHRGFIEAIEIEEAGGATSSNRVYDATTDDVVFFRVVNPHSVDTPQLAQARFDEGLQDSAAVAGPAKIFFQCNGTATGATPISAPDFNLLDQAARQCAVKNVTELRIKFPSINSLRATEPKCAKENAGGPVLGDPNVGQNTTYRDGAITVQAVRVSDGVVIYENSNYEHFKSEYLTDDGLAACATVPELSDGKGGCKSQCGVPVEFLRAYKDPDYFDGGAAGSDDTGGGGVVSSETTGGTQLTENINVTQSKLSDGRVSWREVLGN